MNRRGGGGGVDLASWPDNRQCRGRMDWKVAPIYVNLKFNRNLPYHPCYSGIGKINTIIVHVWFCEIAMCV